MGDTVHKASAAKAQAIFTSATLFEKVYITDIVLGPAAALALSRRNDINLTSYDWWRVALTRQARRALEDMARDMQIARGAEVTQAYRDKATPRPFDDGQTWRRSRHGWGRK
jgi:hypothetical protein